jgi:hypothetical protein
MDVAESRMEDARFFDQQANWVTNSRGNTLI